MQDVQDGRNPADAANSCIHPPLLDASSNRSEAYRFRHSCPPQRIAPQATATTTSWFGKEMLAEKQSS
ncbi:hypothetical protein PM082_015023 [Marasmius tenuissimus]|nr:hypothetical protein PM082_015023 [Marasmius tenuissimus]